MPRSRRKQSGTDVYHIVSRGNNQENIFPESKDKNYFFGIMKTQAEKFEVKIYAYCIMSNHVHILAKVEFKALSLFIQETNSNYAVYYNCKYQKSGHVFQGRFFSSCVETEGYLISCVRYIHNNPVKAGLTSDVRAYLFSSAVYYFGSDKKRTQGIVSEEIFHILEKRFKNFDEFLEFHNNFDNQEFLDIKEEKEEHDFQRAKHWIKKYARSRGIEKLKTLENVPFFRKDCLRKCRQELGMSENKIENILKILAKGD